MENGFDPLLAGEGPVATTGRSHRHCVRRYQTTRSGSCPSAGAMRPRSCNALTVFRVADRDRVNFAVFESAQQHIAAQRFGLKLIAVLQVRQSVRFRSSRKLPQSTLVLCQVARCAHYFAIESGSSATRKQRAGFLFWSVWIRSLCHLRPWCVSKGSTTEILRPRNTFAIAILLAQTDFLSKSA
jgi:hypothetical protein